MDEIRPGILNRRQLIALGKEGVIENLIESDIDPSALDLHLSHQGWSLKGSIKCTKDSLYNEVFNNKNFCPKTINLSTPVTLKKSQTYVVQLKEILRFHKNLQLYGRATGKSNIGRLDVLTRLIVDKTPKYDEIPLDHSGSLYLEITPITFPVIVKEGTSLNQLRVFKGKPEYSELKGDILKLYGELLSELDDTKKLIPISPEDAIDLRLDLRPCEIAPRRLASAFAAKRVNKKIDSAKSEYPPEDYWEIPLIKDNTIEIVPEKFYILRSKERFRLPPDVAVYAQAVSENLGEIRIHYAGFVHPGFGYFREGKVGTPLTFEVRGHNVKTFLRDGETLATIKFYRMSEPHDFTTTEIEAIKRAPFQNQELLRGALNTLHCSIPYVLLSEVVLNDPWLMLPASEITANIG